MTDLAAEMRRHAGAMDLGRVENMPALIGPESSSHELGASRKKNR